MIAIFDIDGVLVDIEHRLPYLKNKNYDKFYSEEELAKDKDIEEGAELLDLMSKSCDVFFVTGRPESTRHATEKLLKRIFSWASADFLQNNLRMRKTGDYRKSSIVKVELVERLLKEQEDNPFASGCSGIFVDDSPENTRAVARAFPNIVGLTFDKQRPKQNKKIMFI